MTRHERTEVETFTSRDWGENAYLVWRAEADEAVAVDPGGEAGALAARAEEAGLRVAAILLTHAHLDHIEGVARLAGATGAPVHLNPGDRGLYDRAAEQAAMFGVRLEAPPPPDRDLVAGPLEVAGLGFEVRAVPGHSPGHVLLYMGDARVAFVGDVVFAGSIGRTDLPGGDHRRLMRSIREEVLTLPDETVLYCGHGPATTVGRERVGNPFLVPMYGGGGLA